MLKQILIPVAAFAVTAVGASAFTGDDLLNRLDLTDDQRSALEEARDIREDARDKAKAVLEAAGLDEEKMQEIHDAMHEARKAEMDAVRAAIEANNYDAFRVAIANSPMADTINTEEKFAKLVEAHTLREAGDMEGFQAIMKDLGFMQPNGDYEGHGPRGMHDGQDREGQ